MKLRIETAEGAREVELPAAGEFTIGRYRDNSLCLRDASVSRAHARISCGPAPSIEDLGSRSGTFVNGRRISAPAALACGDEIKVGAARIRLTGGEAQGENTVDGGTDTFQSADSPATRATAPGSGPRSAPPPPAPPSVQSGLYSRQSLSFAAKVHERILSMMQGAGKASDIANDAELRSRAEECLDKAMRELNHESPDGVSARDLRQMLVDELLDYGPISPLLRDPSVTEIMVNGHDRVFVESRGRLQETPVRFLDERHLLRMIDRIVGPLGRHIDDSSPMVDARLPDGSRVNAVISPLSLDGASLTIRKFADRKLSAEDLVSYGSMTHDMARFLEAAVKARQNILVSGGTGSGKTTLLNILSQYIPEGERLVTVEDSAELKLSHRNIVRLEARPANVEGKGRITIRDLVINCLRMRPDRIIVGECRGAEALDMLQAMNTGHDGSLTTAHANSARDALARLENMVMMAGYELPSSAIREQISSAIDIIVQETRFGDGTRKIVNIAEVTGREGDAILMQDIFEFRQTGVGRGGTIEGFYTATGNIPRFIEEARRRGVLELGMDVFVPKA